MQPFLSSNDDKLSRQSNNNKTFLSFNSVYSSDAKKKLCVIEIALKLTDFLTIHQL